MRLSMVCALVITGCGFESVARPGDRPDSSTDGGSSFGASCDATDPSLRLCLTFDRDPMVQDLSSLAHQVTEATAVGRALRAGSPAAQLDASSRIRIAESSDLDLSELTFDMWILPASIALQASYGLLENHAQYNASYQPTGQIRCGTGSDVVDSSIAVADGQWHHVACTYRGRTMRVYVDGTLAGCGMLRSAVPTLGSDGLAIGASFGSTGYQSTYVGAMDSVHVFARELAPAEVCSAAGKTGCSAKCPSGGGPGGGGPGGD